MDEIDQALERLRAALKSRMAPKSEPLAPQVVVSKPWWQGLFGGQR